MSTIIQIKRSSGLTAPTTSDLLEGELAYAEDSSNNGSGAKLYIESVNSSGSAVIDVIGGKYYTAAVDAATNANTASTIVKRDASGNFSAGTITATLSGNVTGNVTGTVSDISNHDTDDLSEGSSNLYYTDARARAAISVTGAATYNSSTGVINVTGGVTSVNTQTGAVVLDTDDISEGSTNQYYTDARARGAVSASGDLSYNSTTGAFSVTTYKSADFATDLAASSTDDVSEGSTNQYYTDARAQAAISAGGDLSYSNGVVSYTTPDTDGVAEGSSNLYYTDARAQAAISVSGDLTYSGGTVGFALSNHDTDDVAEGATNLYYTDARAQAAITAGTGVTVTSGAVAIGQAVGTTDNVTFNDVTVDGTLYSDDITATNITVAGNLTVSGTTTTVNSSTISVTDPLIFVGNDNNTTDAVDLGMFGMYDTSGSQDLYAGLFRDASDGKWRLFSDLQSAPTTTVDVAGTGYTVASLVANLEGNLTGGTVSGLSAAIGVADGGTGATSLTANGVLFGNGTGAISATAVGTAGQVLLSNGSGSAPSFGNIDGGTY